MSTETSTGEAFLPDEHNVPLYRATWLKTGNFLVEFKLYRITSWDGDDVPLSFEPAADARIKWDGCSDWEWHDSHFCGVHGLALHCGALAWLYQLAGELLGAAQIQFSNIDARDFFLSSPPQ